MKKWMKRSVPILGSLALTLAAARPARADDEGLRWETIVGLMQVGNVVGTGTGAVTGGGQPWSVLSGHASANVATGRVEFIVHGLVLAGGNGIGTSGGIPEVRGTLVCDTAGKTTGGNSVLVDTPLVPFDPQGNARFEGDLGRLPDACAAPDVAFLVRIPAGRWIANGAVLSR